MIRKGVQSTKEKPPDTYLEDKSKKMYCFVQLWNLAQKRKEYFTQTYADTYPPQQTDEKNTSTSCIYMIIIPSYQQQ